MTIETDGRLSIYTIAALWGKETGDNRLYWIRALAKNIIFPRIMIKGEKAGTFTVSSQGITKGITRLFCDFGSRQPSHEADDLAAVLDDVEITKGEISDFCSATGHNLPRFWFETTGRQAGKDLANMRHASENERIDQIKDTMQKLINQELERAKTQQTKGMATIDYNEAWRIVVNQEGYTPEDKKRVIKRLKEIFTNNKSHSGRSPKESSIIIFK